VHLQQLDCSADMLSACRLVSPLQREIPVGLASGGIVTLDELKVRCMNANKYSWCASAQMISSRMPVLSYMLAAGWQEKEKEKER